MVILHGGGLYVGDVKFDGNKEKEFFNWLRTLKCESGGQISLMVCNTALDDVGKEKILNVAIESGFVVKGNEGLIFVGGLGNWIKAYPDAHIEIPKQSQWRLI